MNRYWNYFKSLKIILHAKFKSGSSANIEWLQSFNKRTKISVAEKGSITIGRGVVTKEGVRFQVESGKLTIGKGCFFNSNCHITCIESIEIGEGCSLGPNIVIVDHDHNFRHKADQMFISSPISIGKNVWIGANSVILRGATIGDDAVIAAGSIVKGTIPKSHLFYEKKNYICKPIE